MILRKHKKLFWPILTIMLIGLLLWAAQPVPITQAQIGVGLPPRATPVPAPPDDDEEDSGSIGAYIELDAPGAPAGAWSVVQWQVSAGAWHQVEGWQAALDQSGGLRWWVDAKDFGKGPFRWTVTTGAGGAVWGVSQPFNLPARADETLLVTLSPLAP